MKSTKVATSVIAVTSALWCGLNAWAQDTPAGVTTSQITIGQTISHGENANPYAASVSMGIRLYIDKTNAGGGVGGRKLVLKVLDDKAKGDLAETNARTLVKEGVFLLFAPMEGGPAEAVAKVAEESGVVLFAPLAGSPALTQPSRSLVFPVRAAHRVEFEKLLSYAQTVGLSRIAFLRSDSAIGKAHSDNMSAEAKKVGRELVAELVYKDDFTDAQIDALVAKARESNAQAIINHGSPRLYERFILRSKAASFKPHFFAVNAGSSEIASRLGPDARGIVFSQITPSPDNGRVALVREFQNAWRAAYPRVSMSHGALEGFMSAKALVIGLQRASYNLTKENFIDKLYAKPIDLGGLDLMFAPNKHLGMRYVDLSFVRDDGKFAY